MTNTLLARVLESSNMDPSVRPQDDFYRHVNGTWLATHEIPADRPMDGAFHALRDASEKYARAIAQDAAAGRLDDPDADRIATLWTQFLDEDTIEAAGAAPPARRTRRDQRLRDARGVSRGHGRAYARRHRWSGGCLRGY